MMRNSIKTAMVLGVLAAVCAAQAADILVDGVAAQVNDKSIMVSDVMVFVEAQRVRLKDKYSGEDLKKELRKAYDDALNLLIERRLILDAYQAASKDQEKKIPDQFIDERIEGIIRDVFKGDRAEVMAALEKDGLTYDEWRNEIKDQIIVASMRKSSIDQGISIPPQAVRDAYEKNLDKYKVPAKVKIRMIVLKKGASDEEKEKKRTQAEEILKKAKAGADFAELAKSASEDDKASDGGDWGWIEPKILRPELAKLVSSMKEGEISDLIETEDELYIMKCDARGEEKVASFEESQPQIERDLRQDQGKLLYDAWIARLRKSTSVKVFDVCPL